MSSARVALGALLGVVAWLALAAVAPALPLPVRFATAWLSLTAGPGAAIGARLTRPLDPLARLAVILGLGSAATPVLIDLLGRGHLLAVYPYVNGALLGGGLAAWRGTDSAPAMQSKPADVAAAAAVVAIALGLGAIVFAHRLAATPDQVSVFGNYDSLDLAYYASITAEAAHTVPPTASYYAGHALNYAYYPQLVLAMVHRFAAVPTLQMYYGEAWPALLALGCLCGFVFIRAIASTAAAFLSMLLILVAGDFSYLAAWLLPHATYEWDFLLWPTNFLSPTMEVLHFSSWTPSLPLFFMGLFGIVQALRTGRIAWVLASSFLIGVLFQFKPFAWVVLLGALGASTVLTYRDTATWRRLAAIAAASVAFALPFVYRSIALYGDRRSELRLAWFLLPQRMLIKLDLEQTFADAAARLVPLAMLRRPVYIALATVVFLAGGVAMRWIGVPRVWRAIAGREPADRAAWMVLGWTAAAGVGIPFAIVTEPYNDTLQFYQAGLYVLWIFTALALVALARRRPVAGAVAIAATIAVSLPSSLHFLERKWTDDRRPPLVTLTRDEIAIAEYLRAQPVDSTVILHDRPLEPSLFSVVAERRVVLGWGRYAVGSNVRQRDVERFYASAAREPYAGYYTLQQYGVTHVIVRPSRDRVNAEVLAHLRPVLQFPDLVLYEVPADVRNPLPAGL